MALINCPKCGNLISDRALKCPKCGYEPQRKECEEINQDDDVIFSSENDDEGNAPKSNRMKWLLWVVLALILAVGVGGYLWHDNRQKEVLAAKLKHEQDSIEAVQREQARLDSLRQDSILKVENFRSSDIVPSDILKLKKFHSDKDYLTGVFKSYEGDFYAYFNSFLLNKGYRQIGHNVTEEYSDADGGYNRNEWLYEKICESDTSLYNKVTLIFSLSPSMIIDFSDKERADAFMRECKKMGFSKSEYWEGYACKDYGEVLEELMINQNGNRIILNGNYWP